MPGGGVDCADTITQALGLAITVALPDYFDRVAKIARL